MTPNEVTEILRHLDGWPVQKHSCKKVQEAIDAAVETVERMENMKAALRQHHKNAMGEGFDPSHPLTKLRVSAYQQTNLYANTIAALEEPK